MSATASLSDASLLNVMGEAVHPAHARIPDDIVNCADYERHAAHHMEAMAWRHLQGGSDQGLALLRNRAAFDRMCLVPQSLADLRGGHTRTHLLGKTLAHPIMLAPVAYHRLAHPDGELATVRASMALQSGFVASTLSSYTLEQIAAAAQETVQEMGWGAPLWFQLYSQHERAHTLALLRRAEKAGYDAVVWTVDAAVKRSSFALPPGVKPVNLCEFPEMRHTARVGQSGIVLGTPLADMAPTWEELRWLRAQTRLPLLVKGILSASQAREALGCGVDGLIVSNHGGRVQDCAPSPMEMLPAIRSMVDQIKPGTPVLLDSGVRWGTDIAKALALGAQAVLVGRPQIYALAVGGISGVAHLLHLLRTELEVVMAQLGCSRVEQLVPDLIWCPSAATP